MSDTPRSWLTPNKHSAAFPREKQTDDKPIATYVQQHEDGTAHVEGAEHADHAAARKPAGLLSVLSNQFRGHAPVREHGGYGPVTEFPGEIAGVGTLPLGHPIDQARYDDLAHPDVVRLDHAVAVRADGVFNGYDLPSRSWQSGQVTFGAAPAGGYTPPVLVIGREEMRLDLLIKVFTLPNGLVYIGPRPDVSPSTGYPMGLSESLSFKTVGAVWAVTTSTTAGAAVAMSMTFREG